MTKEILQDLFSRHPDATAFHFTSDGTSFFEVQNANAHASNLMRKKEAGTVTTVTKADFLAMNAAPAKNEALDAATKALKAANGKVEKLTTRIAGLTTAKDQAQVAFDALLPEAKEKDVTKAKEKLEKATSNLEQANTDLATAESEAAEAAKAVEELTPKA